MASWYGEDNPPAVLNLMRMHNESDLIIALPAYKAMAASPK